MTYQIMIDEEQRILLGKVLACFIKADSDDPSVSPEYKAELDNAKCFLSMVEDLPRQEAETPDCLHGFCL